MILEPTEIKHFHIHPATDIKDVIFHFMRLCYRGNFIAEFDFMDVQMKIYPGFMATGFDNRALEYLNQWRTATNQQPLNTLSDYGKY